MKNCLRGNSHHVHGVNLLFEPKVSLPVPCHTLLAEAGTTAALHWLAGKLVGDVLLAAAFVSYGGPFNMPLREELVKEKWHPDILARSIPMSDGITPLEMLTDDATKVWMGSLVLLALEGRSKAPSKMP